MNAVPIIFLFGLNITGELLFNLDSHLHEFQHREKVRVNGLRDVILRILYLKPEEMPHQGPRPVEP